MKALPLKLLALGVLVGVGVYSQSSRPAAEPSKARCPRPGCGASAPCSRGSSPDGKDIVFSYQGQILAGGGGGRRHAAAGGGPGYAVEPCWSPDGQRIAFLQSKTWGSGQVKVIDAQTGKLLSSPQDVLGTGTIAFTADGKSLLGNLRKPQMLDAFRSPRPAERRAEDRPAAAVAAATLGPVARRQVGRLRHHPGPPGRAGRQRRAPGRCLEGPRRRRRTGEAVPLPGPRPRPVLVGRRPVALRQHRAGRRSTTTSGAPASTTPSGRRS